MTREEIEERKKQMDLTLAGALENADGVSVVISKDLLKELVEVRKEHLECQGFREEIEDMIKNGQDRLDQWKGCTCAEHTAIRVFVVALKEALKEAGYGE